MTRGLTQERLAERADLNLRTVQKIEAGTITILATTLHRLRAALGLASGHATCDEFVAMPRLTARTAPKLTPAQRKAEVEALVADGRLSRKRAKLIEFREPTAAERKHAETLVGKGRAALARAAVRHAA